MFRCIRNKRLYERMYLNLRQTAYMSHHGYKARQFGGVKTRSISMMTNYTVVQERKFLRIQKNTCFVRYCCGTQRQ